MPQAQFLGTMAGIEELIESSVKNECTYTRTYDSDRTYDRVRHIIGSDEHSIRVVGEQYSYTPPSLKVLDIPFSSTRSSAQSSLQGGGYFLSLPPSTSFLSPANYALSQYGPAIEAISGLSLNALQAQTDAYSIRYIIYHYFDSIKKPQEGDLVFYSKPLTSKLDPLVGIFKKTKPNWNSPRGGTVVYKYNTLNKGVFQGDVFFAPHYYGNTAEFYRLKTHPVPLELYDSLAPNKTIPPIPYYLSGDHFICSASLEEREMRAKLTIISHQLMDQFEQIQKLNYIQFQGVCYHYAFGKFLKTYLSPAYMDIFSSNQTLFKYFDSTLHPQQGDLIVYYDDEDNPVHYGIYLKDNWVESKWGEDPIYRHALFDVPDIYGDRLKFLKLKPGLSKKWFYFNIKLDHEGRSKNDPIILNQDTNGYKSVLLFSYKKPKLRDSRNNRHISFQKWRI